MKKITEEYLKNLYMIKRDRSKPFPSRKNFAKTAKKAREVFIKEGRIDARESNH